MCDLRVSDMVRRLASSPYIDIKGGGMGKVLAVSHTQNRGWLKMTDIVGAVKQLKLERDALLAENLDLQEVVRREQSRRHTAERRAREWRAKHNSLIKDAAQLVKAVERCRMGEAKLKAHLSMVRHVAQNAMRVIEVLAGGEVAKRHLKAEVASLREHLDEIDAAMRVQIREDEGRAAHTEVRGE